MLLAFVVLGGLGSYVVNRAIAEYPQFVREVTRLVDHAQNYLETGPLHLDRSSVGNVGGKITSYLQGRQSEVAKGVVSAVGTIVEVGTGVVLTLFLTFFLLYDGERIFAWLTGFVPVLHRPQVQASGEEIWRTLTRYIGGTFLVALFHAVALGIALGVTRVQLVAPLVLLIFIGSFIPIIGMPIFGGLATLVALISRGGVVAIIILVVLVIDNQIESHLLQPLVVGRYVHLHPMVIAIVLTGGAVFAGLPGAIFGIPAVASINAAFRGASRWRRENVPGAEADEIEAADGELAAEEAHEEAPAKPADSAPADCNTRRV
jgi:predicted PurR-regulated permease PerM